MSTFRNTADIYATVRLVPRACQHITVDQSHSSGNNGCENLEISGQWRHEDSVLHKHPEEKNRTWLNPVTGVANALTRHLLFLCVLSTFLASFDWDTLERLCSEPEIRLVERCNHYCFHSTVASTRFLTCFTDLWITLYYVEVYRKQNTFYCTSRGDSNISYFYKEFHTVVESKSSSRGCLPSVRVFRPLALSTLRHIAVVPILNRRRAVLNNVQLLLTLRTVGGDSSVWEECCSFCSTI